MTQLALDPVAHLEKLEKNLAATLKLVKELKDPKVRADLRKLGQRLKKLEESELSEVRQLAKDLEAWRKEQERSRPLQFGRELKEAAEKASVGFATETSDPPCYRLDPLTVEADFTRGRATLGYARIPLGETELDPAAILKERERLTQALAGKDFQPEQFFETLHRAYKRAGGRNGDRVELVEVLAELAFLMQSDKFLKNPVREHYKPYGKVRLAWDLARLRKAGLLQHDGRRFSLGTATIGTTKNKDRVLYLEGPGGKGQYYLTIAFSEDAR